MIRAVWQDVRYGVRGLRARPGFAVLAVLTLALGSGATTTIFSVIQIHDTSSSRPGGRTGFQTPEFLDYQEQNHVFDDVIGGGMEDVLSATSEGTEQFNGGLVN